MINKLALVRRYRDAYNVARVTDSIGKIVQIVGLVLAVGVGGISTLVGMSVGGVSGEVVGALLLAILGGIVGIIPGALISLIGVLLSANGQMLLATLDGTVCSSPFLDEADKVGMMHLQTQSLQPPSSPTYSTTISGGGKNPIIQDVPIVSSNEPSTYPRPPLDEIVAQNITEACKTLLGIREDQMHSDFWEHGITPGSVLDLLDSIDERFGYYIPTTERDALRCPADIIAVILDSRS